MWWLSAGSPAGTADQWPFQKWWSDFLPSSLGFPERVTGASKGGCPSARAQTPAQCRFQNILLVKTVEKPPRFKGSGPTSLSEEGHRSGAVSNPL